MKAGLMRAIKGKEIMALGVTILLFCIVASVNPAFLRPGNLFDIIKSNAVLALLACAMLLPILTGGIDVSIGSITAASSCVAGVVLSSVTDNLLVVFLAGAAMGTLLGLVNGLAISRLNIPPIVATLGMSSIINGSMLYITKGTWIYGFSPKFVNFGRTRLFPIEVAGQGQPTGLPIQAFFIIGVALITAYLLRYTRFGRGIYAIGGNRISAERVGCNVPLIQTLVYAYVGLLAGIASVVHISIVLQVDPNAFIYGFEMQVIAAVVIGGAALTGGYGTVFGTLVGVTLLAISSNGLTLMRIPTYWQQIVVGAIILISVTADLIQQKRTAAQKLPVNIS